MRKTSTPSWSRSSLEARQKREACRVIAVGKKLPAFSLPRSDGSVWKTSDVAGSKLVLYFYPKDMTPGCTLEGRDFRDLHPAFRRARTSVLGISKDSCERHAKFRAREDFPFELLSDEDEKVC